MKNKEITIDELLEKIPNKYELSIIAGRMAREEFLKGKEKNQIMTEVFREILREE